MDQYEQIEQKYGLVLPEAYRSMDAGGWFDAKSDNFFWLWEVEWMSLEEILNYQPKEYHKAGFVPFAKTAGGDRWCWWPSTHPETIVLCPHDSYDGKFFAPTFIGFVYRNLLEFSIMVGLNPTDDGFDPDCDPVQEQVIKEAATRLAPYLPNVWRETLQSLASASPTRRIHNGKDVGSAILTEERYKAIVQRDLAFPLLDQTFEWMNPNYEEGDEE